MFLLCVLTWPLAVEADEEQLKNYKSPVIDIAGGAAIICTFSLVHA